MSKSRAAGWPEDAPTAAQLKEFFAQIDSGRIKKDRFQVFLRIGTYPDIAAAGSGIRELLRSGWRSNDPLDKFLTATNLFLIVVIILMVVLLIGGVAYRLL